ncbi:MAG: hypothetical protein RL130_657 [Actinomycetota bacterium]
MSTATVIKAKKKNHTPQHIGSTRAYYFYVLPGLIAFAAVAGGAFAYNFYLSFTDWAGYGKPIWVGLQNYSTLMHDATFWASFLHSFEFILAMSIIPTFIGLLFAAIIYDFIAKYFGQRWSTFLRISFYLPQIIALPVTGLLWSWLLSPNSGAINTMLKNVHLDRFALNWLGEAGSAIFALSVMMVWIQVGYTIIIFVAGMSRIDPSFDEAAQLDGASWWERFRIITVPQVYPELSIVLLTTTVAALKVFGPVFVMTQGGPGNATTVPAMYSYFNFFSSQKVGYGAAVATSLALLLTVLAIFLLRFQRKIGASQ